MIKRAVSDTDILIHLYRSSSQDLIYKLFTGIEFHEQTEKEVNNHGEDVIHFIQKDLLKGAGLLRKVTNEALKDETLLSVFQAKMKIMDRMFMPSELGEQCAIALAQTHCITVLLTDDTKDDGPYHTVNRQLCEDMDIALGFWDLIYLNRLIDYIPTINDAELRYNHICKTAYEPPYRASFRTKMLSCVRKFEQTKLTWYLDWCKQHTVTSQKRAFVLQEVRSLPL